MAASGRTLMVSMALGLLFPAGALLPVTAEAFDEQLQSLNRLCRKSIDSADYRLEAGTICRRVNFEMEKLAPGSPEHVVSLVNLGDLKRKDENFVDADEYYATALEFVDRRDKFGIEAADLLEVQAQCKVGRGKLADAELLLRRAIQIRERLSGPRSVEAARTRLLDADVLALMAQYNDAQYAYRGALTVFLRGGAATRIESLNTQRRVAEMMERQSRFDQAETEYRRLLAAAQTAPADRAMAATALDRLGWMAAQGGRPAEAAEFYRQEIVELAAAAAGKDAIASVQARLASLANPSASP